MSLRITILTLIACLLTTTVATIGGLGFYFTRESVEDLQKQYLQAVSEGAAKGIDALTQTALPLLSSIDIPERLGSEIGEDEKKFVHELAGHIRTIPELSYLNYGDQHTGHYIAVRREENGKLIFNRAHPLIDAGHEFEWHLDMHGEISALPKPKTPVYDPRTRDWYKLAIEKGFVWTRPYPFFSGGGRGISASLPVLDSEKKPRGVISLAISLDHLANHLKSLRKDSNVEIYVLLKDASLVASSSTDSNSGSALALNSALAQVSQDLDLVSAGASIISEIEKDDSYSVNFYPYSRNGSLLWSIAVVIPESSYLGVVTYNAYLALGVGLVALVLALGLGFIVADRISTPLKIISLDLEQVAQFNISTQKSPKSVIHEIAIVGDSIARMKAGLRSFSRYVPHEEVRKIIASGSDISLGAEIRQLSLHFSDLANFSSISEILSPTDLVNNLAEYLEILTKIIHTHNGTVVQYTGDGLFAFFNAPILDSQHPLEAVSSALAITARLSEVNIVRREIGAFEFTNRIGLHTAEVVVGNLGTESKLVYSAIGDGVNLASRLEGLNKIYGTSIIASEALKKLTGEKYLWRLLDKVAVVGRKDSTLIFEPICSTDSASEVQEFLCYQYESALKHYFAGDFIQAKKGFSVLTDCASKEMLRRCESLILTPPSLKWDGTFVSTVK